jgi:dTDP-4-amino-4,6-dideoxygalactose transaminase
MIAWYIEVALNAKCFDRLIVFTDCAEIAEVSLKYGAEVPFIRDKDIGVNVHYIPVHLQPYKKSLDFPAGDFPEAERYYEKAISLPLFPQLTYTDQDYVINRVREAMV